MAQLDGAIMVGMAYLWILLQALGSGLVILSELGVAWAKTRFNHPDSNPYFTGFVLTPPTAAWLCYFYVVYVTHKNWLAAKISGIFWQIYTTIRSALLCCFELSYILISAPLHIWQCKRSINVCTWTIRFGWIFLVRCSRITMDAYWNCDVVEDSYNVPGKVVYSNKTKEDFAGLSLEPSEYLRRCGCYLTESVQYAFERFSQMKTELKKLGILSQVREQVQVAIEDSTDATITNESIVNEPVGNVDESSTDDGTFQEAIDDRKNDDSPKRKGNPKQKRVKTTKGFLKNTNGSIETSDEEPTSKSKGRPKQKQVTHHNTPVEALLEEEDLDNGNAAEQILPITNITIFGTVKDKLLSCIDKCPPWMVVPFACLIKRWKQSTFWGANKKKRRSAEKPIDSRIRTKTEIRALQREREGEESTIAPKETAVCTSSQGKKKEEVPKGKGKSKNKKGESSTTSAKAPSKIEDSAATTEKIPAVSKTAICVPAPKMRGDISTSAGSPKPVRPIHDKKRDSGILF